MIIRYGRVVCRNFQSVRLEVEEEFDSNKWSYDEGLCAVKAIVFAALRLPVPQYEKCIAVAIVSPVRISPSKTQFVFVARRTYRDHDH